MRFELIPTKQATFEVMRALDSCPSVVVLPGAAGGIRDYADLCRRLDDLGLPSLGINPRTCGGSTGSLEGVTFHELATDVIEVIEAVAEPPVLLAGHAGGNRVARMVATLRSELVSGLVLIAAGGKVPPEPEAWAALGRLGDEHLSVAQRRKVMRIAMFAPDRMIRDSYLAQGDVSSAFSQAFGAAVSATPTEEWWGGGSVEMLVIQGKQDRIAPVANGHQLHDQFPDRVRIVDLDNAGHALFLEQPDEISRLIAGFAEEISAAENTRR